MHTHDIAVIGGGAAGTMAAIRAGQLSKNVVLIERNASIGKKILLTGKGRCNITNTAAIETFIEKFGREGPFLRTAFSAFFNEDLMEFFEKKNLELISERQGRVFPATYRARSVIEVLKEYLAENKIKILYGTRLADLKIKDGSFELELINKEKKKENMAAKHVILSTGGLSYKMTGSTGDGFRFARKLGHAVVPLKPGLVPLRTKETWVKELQGLVLKNVCLTFHWTGGKILSRIGEMLFTHFGVSGPLVLDLSGAIVSVFDEHKEIGLFIDLKPGLDTAKLEKRLLEEFASASGAKLESIMKNLLPQRLVPVFLRVSGADAGKKGNQVTQKERKNIAGLLKAFPLTITGSLSVRRAMVTGGGVSIKEINPRTMESKVVPGLFFAGEIIEGQAPSGGYNLQQAFSTGYLAGESAANA